MFSCNPLELQNNLNLGNFSIRAKIMKKPTLFILSLFVFILSTQATLAYQETLTITVAPRFANSICKKDKWNPIKVSWQGVTDRRTSKTVATITNKRHQSHSYGLDRPLSHYFDQNLIMVFQRCGLVIVPKGVKAAYKARAQIKTFLAKTTKDVDTPELQGTSELVVSFESRFSTVDVKAEHNMETKNPPSKNKKKVEKIISDLFEGTLEEIISSNQISFLKP